MKTAVDSFVGVAVFARLIERGEIARRPDFVLRDRAGERGLLVLGIHEAGEGSRR